MRRCRDGRIPVAHKEEFIAVPRLKNNEPIETTFKTVETPFWVVAENEQRELEQALTKYKENENA